MTDAPGSSTIASREILAALERNGLADNTIVIITSDHGDDHYEPGVTLGHGLTFNGGLQANHVPMIVHVPGATAEGHSGNRAAHRRGPDTCGFHRHWKNPPPGRAGVSPAWIHGTETPENRPFYGETGFPFIQFTVPGSRASQAPADGRAHMDR